MSGKGARINVVDVIVIVLVLALAVFAALRALGVGGEVKKVDNTVEITLTPTDGIDRLSHLAVGDALYIDGCSRPLGTVSEISVSEEADAATVRVTAKFAHDAAVYAVDGVPVARGMRYKLRAVNFTCEADCTGVRVTVYATSMTSEE